MKEQYKNHDVFELKAASQRFSNDVELVASDVIDHPKFPYWCGGLGNQHHFFEGGLARHTREVLEVAFGAMHTLKLENEIDKTELFLACLFHDAGKMYDYEKDEVAAAFGKSNWVAAPHKRLIHHISRSAIIWTHAVAKSKTLNDKYHDSVLHAILAHHGQREWGSPVMPKSRVAWLLHLSDGISARMNDCNTVDLVYLNRK
jgi:3'-5' exoribonuclease